MGCMVCTASLRAQRSNLVLCSANLDCFAALTMTGRA